MAKKLDYDWQNSDAGLVIEERPMKVVGLFFMICFGGMALFHFIPMLLGLLGSVVYMLLSLPAGILPSTYELSGLWDYLLGMLFTLPFLMVGVWGLWLYMRKHSYTFEQDKRELVHLTYSFRKQKLYRIKFDEIAAVILEKKGGSVEQRHYYFTVGLRLVKGGPFTLELTNDYSLALSRAEELQRILQVPEQPDYPALEVYGM